MVNELRSHQLQVLLDQKDYDGARKLIEEALQQPLSASEEGMYYAELMRVYIRYMTAVNEELTSALEDAQDLLREIDRREQEALDELARADSSQQ